MRRITVELADDDQVRLAALAQREARDPRRQASRLLAEALRRVVPEVAPPEPEGARR